MLRPSGSKAIHCRAPPLVTTGALAARTWLLANATVAVAAARTTTRAPVHATARLLESRCMSKLLRLVGLNAGHLDAHLDMIRLAEVVEATVDTSWNSEFC
jgi:hypothetical protein